MSRKLAVILTGAGVAAAFGAGVAGAALVHAARDDGPQVNTAGPGATDPGGAGQGTGQDSDRGADQGTAQDNWTAGGPERGQRGPGPDFGGGQVSSGSDGQSQMPSHSQSGGS